MKDYLEIAYQQGSVFYIGLGSGLFRGSRLPLSSSSSVYFPRVVKRMGEFFLLLLVQCVDVFTAFPQQVSLWGQSYDFQLGQK